MAVDVTVIKEVSERNGPSEALSLDAKVAHPPVPDSTLVLGPEVIQCQSVAYRQEDRHDPDTRDGFVVYAQESVVSNVSKEIKELEKRGWTLLDDNTE